MKFAHAKYFLTLIGVPIGYLCFRFSNSETHPETETIGGRLNRPAIPESSNKSAHSFFSVARNFSPKDSLEQLTKLNEDAQAVRAGQELAIARFKDWCGTNPHDAISWLAHQNAISTTLRRRLAEVAGDQAPTLMLEISSSAGEPATMLDMLSIALKSAKNLDETTIIKLFKASVDRFPGTSSLAYAQWSQYLQQHSPETLLTLAETPGNLYWREAMKTDAIIGLVETDFSLAMNHIAGATEGTYSPQIVARALARVHPENLDAALDAIKDSPYKSRFAYRIADTATIWPESSRLALIEWSGSQDEATRHMVTTRLVNTIESLSGDGVRTMLSSLAFDQRVENAAMAAMSRSGDISAWLGWFEERGGISEVNATKLASQLDTLRPQDYREWQLKNPNRVLSESIKRKNQ